MSDTKGEGGKLTRREERLEQLAEAVIPEAIEWVRELRAYRVYQGASNPEFFRKARIALGVVGNGVRLCATIENSRANTILERRAAEELPPAPRPALTDGAPA